MFRSPVACPDCSQPSVRGSRYCQNHVTQNANADMRRAQDKQRRAENPYRGWYGLRIWHDLKKQFFNLNPLNAQCAFVEQRTGARCNQPTTDVDHIVPHRGNWDLFTDLRNMQGLCHTHHSQKTAREDGGFGR